MFEGLESLTIRIRMPKRSDTHEDRYDVLKCRNVHYDIKWGSF